MRVRVKKAEQTITRNTDHIGISNEENVKSLPN
jgi:hypothetical protein